MTLYQSILSRSGFLVIAIFFFVFIDCTLADSFSKFGIIRANIAKYIGDQRWLVCYAPKIKNEILSKGIRKTEVIGFDRAGNIFRIVGDLHPDASNLLSLASYEEVSVTFSTKEGYLYVWNTVDGENPFEYHLHLKEYQELIEKFELYPLLNDSKNAPIRFELLKENPEFYDRALALPRPKSAWHFENPTAKRFKVGILLADKPNNNACVVEYLASGTVAKAADIRPGDIIMNLAVDGSNVEMEKFFPLQDDMFIRLLTLKIIRRSDDGINSILDINIFPPSPFEYFLKR